MTPGGRDGQAVLRADAALEQLVRFEAQRALQWYDVGLRLMPLLDRRSAACTGAMAGIYLRLLEQISADPAAALARRLSVPGAGQGHGGGAVAGRPGAPAGRPARTARPGHDDR